MDYLIYGYPLRAGRRTLYQKYSGSDQFAVLIGDVAAVHLQSEPVTQEVAQKL
jgi:hypothetical protein